MKNLHTKVWISKHLQKIAYAVMEQIRKYVTNEEKWKSCLIQKW